MASAVLGWSPVIMTMSTPARRSSSTAAAAVGRTWSARPRKPSRHMPDTRSSSMSAPCRARPLGHGQDPQPLAARRSTSASSWARGPGGRADDQPSAVRHAITAGQDRLGCALDDHDRAPSGPVPTTAWKPRAGSKASSPIWCQPPSPSAARDAGRSAASTTAWSVAWGSGVVVVGVRGWPAGRRPGRHACGHRPGPRWSSRRRRRPAVGRCGPAVSVPVLSKQSTSTRPSASMVRGLRTRAPRRDSRWAALSWATVASRGRPFGHRRDHEADPRCRPRRAAGGGAGARCR